MIPVRGGGRGIPQFSVHTGPGQCPSRKRAQGLFRSRNPPLADGPPNAKHHAQCWYRIWYNDSIVPTARKITVEIPDELLQKAQKASGTGITQTVRTGLQLLAASQAYDRLLQLRGKVRFSRTFGELKRDR